jgi:HK97 family phage major capsid protein/HK97 family phage prohead protease
MYMTHKAYSLLTVSKAYDDDKDERIVKGIASTPTPDRSNDIVLPEGAQFSLPMPLLSQHGHDYPIGQVIEAKVTKKGIEITAKIAKGIDYVDRAWAQIKSGLVRGFSIGFRPMEYEEHKNANGFGYTFKSYEIFEISAVTIPANAEATISMVKSIATSGVTDLPKKATPRALGKTTSVKLLPKGTEMKSFAEQIKGFEAKKAELQETVKTLLAKSADEGRTLDAEEAEAHDSAIAEIDAVEKHIGRLVSAEKIAVQSATPVAGDTQKSATVARSGGTITVRDNLAPGQEFARYVKCLAQAKGNILQAEQIAKSQYPDNHRIQNVMKAAVASGTTTDATWAGALVEYVNFTGDFINFLRPQTIIGRFGQGGIPSLRSIPFNVRIKGQTSGGEGYWVGEGAGKPLTKFDFNDVELRWAKVANIAVLTDELVRMSTPSAELLVRDSLAAALIQRLDIDFVNPAKASVTNISPASITNGVTAVPASGTDYDAFKVDAKALMNGFIGANIPLSQGVWIMQSTQALSFSLMQNALGQAEFPGMTMNGGTLLGLPVIVSQYVPAGLIVLAAADEIYLADDGQVTIDASREATLEMDNAPTGTATRSMFQNNEIALRAERYINWQKRRAAAVQIITGAAYA